MYDEDLTQAADARGLTRRTMLGVGAAGTAGLLLTAGAHPRRGIPGSYNRMWDAPAPMTIASHMRL